MRPRFEIGAGVRVIRNVRNDGTFPGMKTGDHLVRRGGVGFVRDVGTFLQDQIIYTVHFLDEQMVVGCREEELIGFEEPWNPSRFEFREKVAVNRLLGMNGEVIAKPGDIGEIFYVNRDAEGGVTYDVRIGGHTLELPETVLEPVEGGEPPGWADDPLPGEEDGDDVP